jgi:hypothetical protein
MLRVSFTLHCIISFSSASFNPAKSRNSMPFLRPMPILSLNVPDQDRSFITGRCHKLRKEFPDIGVTLADRSSSGRGIATGPSSLTSTHSLPNFTHICHADFGSVTNGLRFLLMPSTLVLEHLVSLMLVLFF